MPLSLWQLQEGFCALTAEALLESQLAPHQNCALYPPRNPSAYYRRACSWGGSIPHPGMNFSAQELQRNLGRSCSS